MFMITGPQSPSVLSNMVVSIEQHVDWIIGCIKHLREHDLGYAEAQEQAENGWCAHHEEVSNATLLPETASWWDGANIPGKKRVLYPYPGGCGTYRALCDQVAAKGYEGFTFKPHQVAAH
jgi:cyclohexanone monooxygenase